MPALAVTIGRASENVGQAKGLDQNGWRHTAGPKKYRPGAREIHRGKKRHTAGRIERKSRPGEQPQPKNTAARHVKNAAPAKQTEKVAGRPAALAVTVGGAQSAVRKGRTGRKKYDYYQTGAGPHRRIFGKTAAASLNEDSSGPKHTAARLPKQTCPQKSKNDARVAKTNAAAAAIKSTPKRFT